METYKKRAGTSGISGQLYETKLVSLILFRLMGNQSIEEYHLASNMDEIGAFDDVCLKLKIKDHDRNLLILVQAKHKDSDDSTLDDKNELVKWCDSIMRVKDKFSSKDNQDTIFSGNFEDTDCVFIVYTNAQYNFGKSVTSKPFESSYAAQLNEIIATGPDGTQPIYTDADIEDFAETILNEELPTLADRFEKYLNASQSMNIMNDEFITRYHVILGQRVLKVSDIEERRGEKCRVLTFRDDFFTTNDKYLTIFRKHLYELTLKNRPKIKNNKKVDELVSLFLSNPTVDTLSPVIETYITYRNGKLEFITKRKPTDIEQLEKIDISLGTIDETKILTAKTILSNLKLAVPIAFGNVDLAIRGTAEKIDKRLKHLTKFVVELFESAKQTESHIIVTIDDKIDEALLSSNGGIGGGFGNIFVQDETTNYLKFTNDYLSLQNNAKALYLKLKDVYPDLEVYRFDVQTMKVPKLSLDCCTLAREFLSKLVVYSKQSNHLGVEETLRKEIEKHLNKLSRRNPIDSEALFVNYHNEIQKWWLSPKSGQYLTKSNRIYQMAREHIMTPELRRALIAKAAYDIKRNTLRRIFKKYPEKFTSSATSEVKTETTTKSTESSTEPSNSNAVLNTSELSTSNNKLTISTTELLFSTSEHPTSTSSIIDHPRLTSSISEHPTLTSSPSEHPTSTSSIIDHPRSTSSISEHPTLTSSPSEHPTSTSSIIDHPRSTSSTSEHPTVTSSPSEHPTLTSSTSEYPTSTFSTSEYPTSTSFTSEHPTSTSSTSEHSTSTSSTSKLITSTAELTKS